MNPGDANHYVIFGPTIGNIGANVASFSVACWVKCSDTTGGMLPLGRWGGVSGDPAQQFFLYLNPTGSLLNFGLNGSGSADELLSLSGTGDLGR